MELSDGKCLIRPYHGEDIDPLYEAARESIDDIYPWMEWCHPQYSRQESVDWVMSRAGEWHQQAEYSFVITDAQNGRFLGSCGLNQINRQHNFANLGYWVRSSATKRGVASAATRLLAGFGFEELKLNRIEIVAAVGNRASQRVAEKAGARREGVLRRRLVAGQRIQDAVMFSLIPEDLWRD